MHGALSQGKLEIVYVCTCNLCMCTLYTILYLYIDRVVYMYIICVSLKLKWIFTRITIQKGDKISLQWKFIPKKFSLLVNGHRPTLFQRWTNISKMGILFYYLPHIKPLRRAYLLMVGSLFFLESMIMAIVFCYGPIWKSNEVHERGLFHTEMFFSPILIFLLLDVSIFYH